MRNPVASESSTSSKPALGSRNNYIWLIAQTQDMIWSNNSVIIYTQMERPIERRKWIYAVSVRRVDLHPWPSLISLRGGLISGCTRPTMADQDTGKEPLGEGEKRMRFICDSWEGNDLCVVMSLYYFRLYIMAIVTCKQYDSSKRLWII